MQFKSHFKKELKYKGRAAEHIHETEIQSPSFFLTAITLANERSYFSRLFDIFRAIIKFYARK